MTASFIPLKNVPHIHKGTILYFNSGDHTVAYILHTIPTAGPGIFCAFNIICTVHMYGNSHMMLFWYACICTCVVSLDLYRFIQSYLVPSTLVV